MAALLKHVLKRDIIVQAYIETGIEREGLRGLLHINETPFSSNDEILVDFAEQLRNGCFRPTALTPATAQEPHGDSAPAVSPPDEAEYADEARALMSEATEQGGLMILSYVCAFWLTVHPTRRQDQLISEERERDIISEAQLKTGGAFPFGRPDDGVALEDGYQVHSMVPRDANHPEIREQYVLKRNGLFVYVRVSSDDIGEDRQFLGSDRYVSFTTLVTTIREMARFAAALISLYDTDAHANIALTGLQNHALLDDAKLLTEERSRPSRIDRVTTDYAGSAADFSKHADEWAVEAITKCLKALNIKMSAPLVPTLVSGYFEKHP
jgi:hypothetical protein